MPLHPNRRPTPRTLPPFRAADKREAAYAAAAIRPDTDIMAADILPPLYDPREVLALTGIMCPHHDGEWQDLPLARLDPRTPWGWQRQSGTRGRVQRAARGVYVLIEPYGGLGAEGAMKGFKATLLVSREGETTTEHTLVHAETRRPVRFGCLVGLDGAAEPMMQPIVDAGGAPPRGWDWEPRAALDTRWTPDGKPQPGKCAIIMNARPRCYRVSRFRGRILACRGFMPATDSTGNAPYFLTVGAAKSFCERATLE